MTKTFFENFKRRFGEVTMIYFYDPIEKQHSCLNFKSNRINFQKVDWVKDAMLITYIETISYIDWSGNNKCRKEIKVQYIKRENIHQVLFDNLNLEYKIIRITIINFKIDYGKHK